MINGGIINCKDFTKKEILENKKNFMWEIVEEIAKNNDLCSDEIGEKTYTFIIEAKDGKIKVQKAEPILINGDFDGFFTLEFEEIA